MKSTVVILLFAAVLSNVYSAPQFITFQDGKLGVNFLGYHAGVGIGGSLANGTLGGLYAEAGTPTGQSATAGLGGVVDKYGHTSGGLYAGATAGNKLQASAGLSGGMNSDNASGNGFATAQYGNRIVSSNLGGQAGIEGSSGFTYTSNKELSVIPSTHNAEAEIHVDTNVNEIKPSASSNIEIHKTIVKEHHAPPPVVVKEVIIESPPPPPEIIEKHIIHTRVKHRRPHLRKTAFVSGYIGGNVEPAGTTYVEQAVPVERRVDVEADARAHADANIGGGLRHTYRKHVSVNHSPTFFADIFNIPVSTLKAVGNFLGNTAANTKISVEKSASVETGSEGELKTLPSSSSSSHVSVETPTASKFIEDIFAIPINTLGAVNRFLENNVARKNVKVVHEVETPSLR